MKLCHSLVVAALLAPGSLAFGQELSPALPKLSDPLGVSGGAELTAVRLQRSRLGYAVEPVRNVLEISLWFPERWGGKADFYLYQCLEMDPIEDDTGKVLMTWSPELFRHEFRSTETMALLKDMDRPGMLYIFRAEAPAGPATRMKSIKGKFRVSAARRTTLDVANVSSTELKLIEDANLANFPIRCQATAEGGKTTVALRVPHRLGRLEFWDLLGGKGRLFSNGEKQSTEADGSITFRRTYHAPLADDWKLRLTIQVPFATKTFAFEFKDVLLP